MNTNPLPSPEDRPEQRRAFELLLQARNGSLSAEDEAFLQSWFAAHPEDQLNANTMVAHLDGLKDAKLTASSSLISRINAASVRMARESEVSVARSSVHEAEASPLLRIWWMVWGKPQPGVPKVAWNTALVGRSLAVYLGVAVVIFGYLGLSSDAREARAEERDRAWLESPALPPLPDAEPQRRDAPRPSTPSPRNK